MRISLLWELMPRFRKVEVGCTSVLQQLASLITAPGALSRSQKSQAVPQLSLGGCNHALLGCRGHFWPGAKNLRFNLDKLTVCVVLVKAPTT